MPNKKNIADKVTYRPLLRVFSRCRSDRAPLRRRSRLQFSSAAKSSADLVLQFRICVIWSKNILRIGNDPGSYLSDALHASAPMGRRKLSQGHLLHLIPLDLHHLVLVEERRRGRSRGRKSTGFHKHLPKDIVANIRQLFHRLPVLLQNPFDALR